MLASTKLYYGRTMLASLLLPLALWAAPARAADPVFEAMSAELTRSFERLKSVERAPLYFLSYELTDTIQYNVGAANGALAWESDRSFERYLDVDARVGSRRLDNTHEIKGPASAEAQNYRSERKIRVPMEDDVDALRASMWAETDTAYKQAQERYTKVLTNHQVTAAEEDPSDDFDAAMPPVRSVTMVETPSLDVAAMRDRVRRLSLHLKGKPFIFGSSVSFSMRSENRRIVTSEGRRVMTGQNFLRLSYSLDTRTDDGMDLSRFQAYDGQRVDDFPDDAKILKDMDQSIAELEALRKAPVVQPYSGPVILKNRAAAVFFHEILGHRMERQRLKSSFEGQTFAKKLGEKIVSDFISVYDDPTLDRFNGTFLRGAYGYDDEAVPSQRIALVENGVLKNFLLDRSPLSSFSVSNGHGRREPGYQVVARMGNTIVQASKTMTYPQLRQRLIEELHRQGKPFGLLFDDIQGGFTITVREGAQSFKVLPLLVYRIYADGRPDEVVRGVNLVGTPLTTFNKIIAAADDYDIFNGTCGAESGWVPVSAVAPSLLISEMEVEKQQKAETKPPILPPPF